MEISPTNRGICIEQRSCKVRLGEFLQAAVWQAVASGRRLVRYGADSGPCSSSSPDAPSASRELARRSCRPGSNSGSPALANQAFWLSRLRALRQSGLAQKRWRSATAGSREEKVLCSAGTCSGVSASSSVPNQKAQYRAPDQRNDGRKSSRKKTQDREEGTRIFSESFEENASEEDPFSDRPFCASSVSPLTNGCRPSAGDHS